VRTTPVTRASRLVAAVGAATLLVVSVGPASAARRLPTKAAEVDGVTIEVSPRKVNVHGATIAISLDTHERELDTKLAQQSSLTVDGTAWPVIVYEGDPPGGHHREGTLRFRGAGRVSGSMRLVIKGLGRRVEFSWRLTSRGEGPDR